MDSEKTTREFLINHFPLQNKTTNQETKNPPSVLHLKHKSSLFFLITSILNLIKSFKIAVHLGFFFCQCSHLPHHFSVEVWSSAILFCCTWWNMQVLTPKLIYLCRSSFASPYSENTRMSKCFAPPLHYNTSSFSYE